MTVFTQSQDTLLQKQQRIDPRAKQCVLQAYDWARVSYLLLVSRFIDTVEETQLAPQALIFNQFSARGHDLAQILLGSLLTHPHDGAAGYYRSRPFILSLNPNPLAAIASPLARSGNYSDGRDIGVVCNYPNAGRKGAMLFPVCGGVGAQYTPISGWAQSIVYKIRALKNSDYNGAIGVSMGGDSSMSTSGFWAALNIATTNKLPQLFYIEDNGYGISVPKSVQTPGGDQVANLAAYKNLKIFDGDGSNAIEAAFLILKAVEHTRSGAGPCLLRLDVPRLCGHTFQDNQSYKSQALLAREQGRDPLPKLRAMLLSNTILSTQDWHEIEKRAERDVAKNVEKALQAGEPDVANLRRYVFAETKSDGGPDLQLRGGLAADGHQFPPSNSVPQPSGARLNLLAAIRKTLDCELQTNPKTMVFGEDVGPKGGVHAATLGLHKKYGNERVFDTSLSEEGIVGRAVGLALAGLMPVPEIQFRKYAELAAEQLSDTGTMRWRTNNQFAAPMVVRIPCGYARRGDPWHSVCDEVEWAHKVGWQVAMPSNAEDAVGLLRFALRDNNPTIFLEHRALLDNAWARRPYPGDAYSLPFGKAKTIITGEQLTVISWGAMVERCEIAARETGDSIELIDLRTIKPWDKACVLNSVIKTGRCLIVHEDNQTAGFGAEIAAMIADEAFFSLDAPIKRLAMPDIPSPHNIHLLNAAVPTVGRIGVAINALLAC